MPPHRSGPHTSVQATQHNVRLTRRVIPSTQGMIGSQLLRRIDRGEFPPEGGSYDESRNFQHFPPFFCFSSSFSPVRLHISVTEQCHDQADANRIAGINALTRTSTSSPRTRRRRRSGLNGYCTTRGSSTGGLASCVTTRSGPWRHRGIGSPRTAMGSGGTMSFSVSGKRSWASRPTRDSRIIARCRHSHPSQHIDHHRRR